MNRKKLTILFWNINEKPLASQIINLIQTRNIDIIILAECPLNYVTILESQIKSFGFDLSPNEDCPKITIFSKIAHVDLRPIFSSNRMTLRLLKFNGHQVFLSALHLLSKVNTNKIQQAAESYKYVKLIRDFEERSNNYKTIIIGDFNMNPFEEGMANYAGFNAVMTREIARKNERVVQYHNYMYFYNPMWSLFGDLNRGVSGTHYYKDDYQWQMYDQVLIRPQLIENFEPDNLHILTTDGQVNFLKDDGKINTNITSDHLPITFSLNL